MTFQPSTFHAAFSIDDCDTLAKFLEDHQNNAAFRAENDRLNYSFGELAAIADELGDDLSILLASVLGIDPDESNYVPACADLDEAIKALKQELI